MRLLIDVLHHHLAGHRRRHHRVDHHHRRHRRDDLHRHRRLSHRRRL
jgi:hypothetical protein